MAGWHTYDNSFGNSEARFKDTIDGVVVTGYIEDMDGDAVSWGISHDGKEYASGVIDPDWTGFDERWKNDPMRADPFYYCPYHPEELAWEMAKRVATAWINAIPGHPMVPGMNVPTDVFAHLCAEEMKKRLGGKSLEEYLEKRMSDVITKFEEKHPNDPLVKFFQEQDAKNASQ